MDSISVLEMRAFMLNGVAGDYSQIKAMPPDIPMTRNALGYGRCPPF
jgi:hypothetical protein